jgi:hypothetical protein
MDPTRRPNEVLEHFEILWRLHGRFVFMSNEAVGRAMGELAAVTLEV